MATSTRRRPHRDQRARKPPPIFRFDGIPVYDATLVHSVSLMDDDGPLDCRVLLGVGPEHGRPVAYVLLCPCEGVRGLVGDLQHVAAQASEHHPPHEGRYRGSWTPPAAA